MEKKKEACANITKIEAGGKTTKAFSLFQFLLGISKHTRVSVCKLSTAAM